MTELFSFVTLRIGSFFTSWVSLTRHEQQDIFFHGLVQYIIWNTANRKPSPTIYRVQVNYISKYWVCGLQVTVC